MSRALILGGTGLIGRATARRLLANGWQVDVTGRDPDHLPADLAAAGARFLTSDRDDGHALLTAMGGGADLLVDCICYTPAQARLLLPLMTSSSSTVMLSSKAVYVDAAGNHSNSPTGPRFDGPITETQPTMAPSDIDHNSAAGYGANKVAAEQLLLNTGMPVSVLRASKIHGEGALPAREWFLVKRMLDRRPAILLARAGESRENPSAAVNIAALIDVVAAQPGRRILNACDPDAPNVLTMARTAAEHLGHEWKEVLLGDEVNASLGRTPWDRDHPMILDTSAATALGYSPVGDYAATVPLELDWLVSIAERASDGARLPQGFDHRSFDGQFDYDAEDRYLADHPGTSNGAGG